ncbi:MAG: TIR domain-containing protein [Candidatus Thorarchaeota archaeon]
MKNSIKRIIIIVGFSFLIFSIFSQLLIPESREFDFSSLEQVNLPKSSVADLWVFNGSKICSELGTQENPKICSNGDNGAIIVWRDRRNEPSGGDIYAQRIHRTGTLQWTANGTVVCNAINQQYKPEICSDGLGGAFIAWVDERAGDQKIYIQRVTNLELKQFTPNGTIIEPTGNDQTEVKICSDGANGAFIVWTDDKNGNDDIFAQRIDQDGNLLWINEIEVCTESNHQGEIQIINDGQGDLIITWEDSRGISDIYAQKLDSNGNVLWDINGVLVCNEEEDQQEPQLCGDGLGGTIITWYDYREGITNCDVYAQRINSGGSTLWNANGSIVNGENNAQIKCKICSDGNGGAIITWYDYRSEIDYDIYAQRMNSNGNRVWSSSGAPICIEDGYQYDPEICSDGFGGAVIAWVDTRGLDLDIYSQRIDDSSNPYWSTGGTPLTVAGNNQKDIEIIPDNFGGSIITWEDQRGVDMDIYSQRLKEHPIVTINSPIPHALFGDTAPSFNVEYLCADLDDMWYTVNGGANNPISSNGSISQSIWDSLGNGTVTIRFCADDADDLVGYSEVVVYKDILGPDITIHDPENNQIFEDIIPSYSITVEDGNLDTVWYTLNGGPKIIVARGTPVISMSKPIDEEAWNALKEGPVTIQFHANDTLGNLGLKDVTITKVVVEPIPFWKEVWFWSLVGTVLAISGIIIPVASKRARYKHRRKEVKEMIDNYALTHDVKIMISYSHEDAPKFQIPQLSETLAKYDKIEHVLYSQKDTREDFIRYMDKNIRESDAILLFCSKKSLKSEFVIDEWTAARALKKPIIPVFIDKSYIPSLLSAKIGVHFNEKKFPETVEEIYGVVKKRLGEPIKAKKTDIKS